MKYLLPLCLAAACAQPTPADAVAGTFASSTVTLVGFDQSTEVDEISSIEDASWTLEAMGDTNARLSGSAELASGGIDVLSSKCVFYVVVNQDRTFEPDPNGGDSSCVFPTNGGWTLTLTPHVVHGSETDDGSLLMFGSLTLSSSNDATVTGLVSFSLMGQKATP